MSLTSKAVRALVLVRSQLRTNHPIRLRCSIRVALKLQRAPESTIVSTNNLGAMSSSGLFKISEISWREIGDCSSPQGNSLYCSPKAPKLHSMIGVSNMLLLTSAFFVIFALIRFEKISSAMKIPDCAVVSGRNKVPY